MREILFRGKRVDNGKWVCGNLFISDDGECEICYGTPRIRLTREVLPETVGQYTGLTDKNGTKIFKGDIVQTKKYGKDNGTGCNFAVKDIFLISFEDGGYCLRNEWRRFNLRPNTDYEVIGNIHDNPELIGGDGNG